jgi:hypothetical protein
MALASGAYLAKLNLKEYARRGAEVRAAELRAELEQIYRAFPDIRRGRPNGRATDSAAVASPGRGRQRKGMSAAQRKAVSLRMKKYWAERRKVQAR